MDETKTTAPTERLVLERERRTLTAVSRSRWAELERAGFAPRRRMLGNRAAWLYSELLAWMHAQPVGAAPAPREALAARGIPTDDRATA